MDTDLFNINYAHFCKANLVGISLRKFLPISKACTIDKAFLLISIVQEDKKTCRHLSDLPDNYLLRTRIYI